jgi:hypothetical protein
MEMSGLCWQSLFIRSHDHLDELQRDFSGVAVQIGNQSVMGTCTKREYEMRARATPPPAATP